MKKLLLSLFIITSIASSAQQQSFDIIAYTPPKGWKKQSAESSLQLSNEDAATGRYCLITLYKAVPGTADS
ncbi:MAG: hypothetical protein AABZ36_04005, partial [Nitrospirota bacterium]